MESQSQNKFWDLKPFWCQPWTIITFGIVILIFSWTLFNNIIVTSILSFCILIWWVVFLIIAPNAYESISDQK